MKRAYGFTIVELLIVIVVVAILAALSYVGYTNISQRANNAITISAAQSWIKAIKMYEQEKGEIPHLGWDSCLGEGYGWDFGALSSGSNQCLHTETSYYIEKQPIKNALSPYLDGQVPTPSMQTIGGSTNWVRGLTYIAPAVGGLSVMYVVQKGVTQCPTINGIVVAGTSARSGGLICSYPLGQRLR